MGKEETRSVEEIKASWNPPPKESGFETIVGEVVPEGDTRATAAIGTGLQSQQAAADAEEGYASMSKKELQEELESRDLPKSGRVDELIARLEEHDAASADDDDEDDDDEEDDDEE